MFLRVFSTPEEGVLGLLTVPVAIIAFEFGWRAGVATALVSIGWVVVWNQLELTALAYFARGATYVFTALVVGVFADRLREAQVKAVEAERRVAELQLERQEQSAAATAERERLARDTGLEIRPPEHPFEAQGNRDALVELSGALKVLAVSLTKIANDIAWMGSGPRAGLAELFLPELQKGSSIMPGKVNPVIPEVVLQVSAQVIGNDAAITVAGTQGNFELNVRVPLIARNLLDQIRLLTSAATLFGEKCVDGIEVNREMTTRHAEATLASATAAHPSGSARGALQKGLIPASTESCSSGQRS